MAEYSSSYASVLMQKTLIKTSRLSYPPSTTVFSNRSSTVIPKDNCSEDEIVNLTISTPQSRRDSMSSSRMGFARSHSVGSDWTVELACLKQSSTSFEAAVSLKRIQTLLTGIDAQDRVKFCKVDFDSAITHISHHQFMMYPELIVEIGALKERFFCKGYISKIPLDLLQEILTWLPIDDFGPIGSVSLEWKRLSVSDEIWQTFYRFKFLRHNPDTMPLEKANYLLAFRNRLANPQMGDKVEVAWRGKFRLEALDMYQGLAWWVAEVVDKHASQGKYKIRYPGWENKWDEWVPRSRLRWAVDKNEIARIQVNDVVELWCCGANVPGAWLESRVRMARGGRYCVGRVLSTGSLWVDRDRLRLVKHLINPTISEFTPSVTQPQRAVGTGSDTGTPSGRGMMRYLNGDRGFGCAVM